MHRRSNSAGLLPRAPTARSGQRDGINLVYAATHDCGDTLVAGFPTRVLSVQTTGTTSEGGAGRVALIRFRRGNLNFTEGFPKMRVATVGLIGVMVVVASVPVQGQGNEEAQLREFMQEIGIEDTELAIFLQQIGSEDAAQLREFMQEIGIEVDWVDRRSRRRATQGAVPEAATVGSLQVWVLSSLAASSLSA